MDYSLCLFLLLATVSSESSGQFPTSQMIKEWVDQMQKDLIALTDTATGMKDLIEIYHKHRKHFRVESNNAQELVATAAGNIERLLANRSEALKRLATEAEKLQMQHVWQDDSDVEKINYYNAKDGLSGIESESDTEGKKDGKEKKRIPYIPEDFSFDPDFKRDVSYNTTAVHIPTDIYEGSTIILNELNWTEALEDVFRKNKEEDPSLLWQVFGSATGLARYFPASPWMDLSKSQNKIDLYDVRRRPWYIQGAASPKDMLILVDASGSVSGLTLKLIKISVSKMLETLSDDDFVNVVSFQNVAKNVSCFGNLVQANVRNKKILKNAVENITANLSTNYTAGFETAFEQLKQMNYSRANCNKIIMLFTDGGEDRAEKIFQLENPQKNVRVFTFSVGKHNYDKAPIQSMACNNKGYYYEIPSIGAIRLNTQEYLDVLGRPMVKAKQKAKQVQWTNVYLDALELGLVITGTLPVFNKTGIGSKKPQNQLILGVMAIDVSLDDIRRLTPQYTFGPNGYYFAIDPNGYVLLHPNLNPQTAKFHEPVTLDFLDAEIEDDIKVQIRKQMIQGETGSATISTLLKSTDKRYIDRGQRMYTFAPVKGTDYSLALVLPEYSMHYIRATIGDTITQAKSFLGKNVSESLMADKFDEYGYTLIAPRDYCKDLKPDANNTEFLKRFNDYIDRKTPNNPMCNVDLVNRLLLDAGITSDLIKIWKENDPINGVMSRYVATEGGITRVYPTSNGLDWTGQAETYDLSFYKRSLDNDLYIFTPTVFENISQYEGSVLVSKAVNLKIDDTTLKPAVVGVHLDIDMWREIFSNTSQRKSCKDELCGCTIGDKNLNCYILDDGGFLVMTNQIDHFNEIGKFFGEIDPCIMRSLINSSLYTNKSTYNYQSLCDPKKEDKTSAGLRSVYVPTIADILNLGWWATAAAWSVMQQLVVSITLPNFGEAATDDAPDVEKEVCIKEEYQYYFENDSLSFRGVIDTEKCSRLYHAERLPKTNLVFIVAETEHGCECQEKILKQEEQESQGPDPCQLASEPRYRKGPAACFDNNSHEDNADCGGVSGLTPSLWLVLSLQLLLVWVVTDTRHHAIPS
uniref:voltage-dependent calcium channel subunit alpha-2/delta-1a n=1 Tax=Maylandia zebra TaxID=106582 RepID=UPI00032983B9|nr:voltage-dependent calcium channel subunit alpha-2/delta-1 [Maylandia zebra]